jgi:V/A-type H+-transporting ATPase subunit I
MNKITVLGLIRERASLLESLQGFGVVDISQEEPGEELKDKAKRPQVQSELYGIDANLADLNRSIEILSRYVPVKKPMFSARRLVSEAEYLQFMKQREDALNIASRINRYEDEITKMKGEENRITGLLASLNPWLDMDIPLDVVSTRSTVCLTGSLPITKELEKAEKELSEVCPQAVLLKGISNRELSFVAVIVHKSGEAAVSNLIREWGFNRITLRDVEGTARASKERLEKRFSVLNEDRVQKLAAIKDLARERELLENVSDGYRMERARIEAKSKLVSTRSVFILKGWLPVKQSEKVKDYLDKNFFCSVEINEPEKDESYPVLIENGPVVEAITPIMKMYGTPSSGELDPSAVMFPFYIFFFGLMLGDAGYGLLIALGTGFVLKKYRLEDSARQFMKLLFFCGLATVFAGILFGSFFGISALTKYALWIVPTETPELMMSWAILFGIVHMFVGLFMKALNLIRRGQVWDAVCDVLFIYIMFTGFILTLLPYAPGIDTSNLGGLVKTGNYLFLAGVVLVILTHGRHSKNIFGKVFGGVGKLYDVVAFFGDCLSYSRILALGLASSIIGDIINTLSMSFGDNIFIKIFAGGAILIIGHSINFALNALGAYVHSSRLQFLEFFGKFLEGGGEPFKPFKANTQYIIVKAEVSKLLHSGERVRNIA